MSAMTATCAVCEQPCVHQQWACWSVTDVGRVHRVDFTCSERCLGRHEQGHATEGREYHQREVTL